MRRRDDLRLDLEEGEEVVEVERLPRHLREAGEQAFEQVAQSAEGPGQEGEVADGEVAAQRAPGDEGIGQVVPRRAQRGEQAAPAGAAHGQAAVGFVELGGQRAVALDEEGVEAEDLHLLRRVHAGAGLAHVVQLAALGRTRVVERVALRVEVRLAQEGRHQRQQQQADEPGRVDGQPGRETEDGHHVLRLAEELAQKRDPPAGLAACAIEPVLQLAVLEVLEVEGRRVLHEAHAGGDVVLLREQRLRQGDHAPQHVRQDGQAELQDQEHGQPVEHSARQPIAQPRRPVGSLRQQQHLVDDQLPDVEGGHRQQRAQEAHEQVGRSQAGARLPDQLQEGREIAQGAEALPQRLRWWRRRHLWLTASPCSRPGFPPTRSGRCGS